MIKVEHLKKYYGDFLAVKDLSFEIGEGAVYGFLGPNGAGKSTTMNIITGCLSPTEGKITVAGYDILEEPQKARRLIGYLPEHPPLYQQETPEEYLRFVGEAKGLRGGKLQQGIDSVLVMTGLESVRGRLISALSKGYQQRVGIAQALLGDPPVIILDEPTVGLDPIQIIEIRDLIKRLGESHTVILSSHILSEVQTICEKVLIISGGELVAFDTPENLEKQERAKSGIHLTVLGNAAETEAALSEFFPEEPDRYTVSGGPEAAPETAAESNSDEVSDEVPAEGNSDEVPDEVPAETASEGKEPDGSLGCTTEVHIRTEDGDAKKLCRDLFFHFAGRNLALIGMSIEHASLEKVFVELTEQSEEREADAS